MTAKKLFPVDAEVLSLLAHQFVWVDHHLCSGPSVKLLRNASQSFFEIRCRAPEPEARVTRIVEARTRDQQDAMFLSEAVTKLLDVIDAVHPHERSDPALRSNPVDELAVLSHPVGQDL